MKPKNLAAAGMACILTIAIFTTAYAAATETYSNYVGNSSAIAKSTGRNAVEMAGYYACDMSSSMSPAVTINVIGKRWAACSVKCKPTTSNPNPPVLSSTSAGGGYVTGSYYGGTLYVPQNGSNSCNKLVVAEATHDFNHTGAPLNWTPYTRHNFYP